MHGSDYSNYIYILLLHLKFYHYMIKLKCSKIVKTTSNYAKSIELSICQVQSVIVKLNRPSMYYSLGFVIVRVYNGVWLTKTDVH